jgi:6-phosphogluconolactonase
MARKQLSTMDASYQWHDFADRDALAAALSGTVAERLAQAISQRGEALLAVSGGTTPGRFFTALSKTDIDWSKVTATLVDERFVPPSSPRSNAALVAAKLLRNRAAAARFVPLFRKGETVNQAADDGEKAFRALPLPFDALMLGMGGDGHTASLFPDAEGLHALLDPASPRIIMPVHAASAGEPRLTLTLAAIVRARFVGLHIEGAEKRRAFEGAMGAGEEKPIRAVIDALADPVEVFWAP